MCAAIVDRLTVGGDIIETCPPQPSDARVHRHDRPQRARRQNSGSGSSAGSHIGGFPTRSRALVHEPLLRDLIVAQDDWIEHRRPDGERIGWMRPEGKDFVPVDLLGRDLSPAADWLSAERALNEAGIGYLADPYELRLDDGTGAAGPAGSGASARVNPGRARVIR